MNELDFFTNIMRRDAEEREIKERILNDLNIELEYYKLKIREVEAQIKNIKESYIIRR